MQLGAAGLSNMANSGILSLGRTYWFTIKIRLAAGTATTLRIGNSVTSGGYATITGIDGTERTFTGTFIADFSSTGRLGSVASNGSAYEFRDLNIGFVGAITLPEVTPDNILRDVSLLAPPIDGYTIGCTAHTGAADGWIRARRTTDGFLMVDGQIVGTNRGIVQAWARSVSGGTITLGDTAGAPATLVASISLTAGVTTPLTLLKSITTGGKIYLDLGTATDAELYLRTGPIASTLVN